VAFVIDSALARQLPSWMKDAARSDEVSLAFSRGLTSDTRCEVPHVPGFAPGNMDAALLDPVRDACDAPNTGTLSAKARCLGLTELEDDVCSRASTTLDTEDSALAPFDGAQHVSTLKETGPASGLDASFSNSGCITYLKGLDHLSGNPTAMVGHPPGCLHPVHAR